MTKTSSQNVSFSIMTVHTLLHSRKKPFSMLNGLPQRLKQHKEVIHDLSHLIEEVLGLLWALIEFT